MLIKDGNHGYTAKVGPNGRLYTYAITKSLDAYVSLVNGLSFVASVNDIDEPNNTTKGLISITNNSNTNFLTISSLSQQFVCPTTSLPSVDDYYSCYIRGSAVTGGTEVSTSNCNATSNNIGDHIVFKDGFTQTNKGDLVHRSFINNGVINSANLDGIYVLGTGDIFSLYWTSGTENTDGSAIINIKFNYIEVQMANH